MRELRESYNPLDSLDEDLEESDSWLQDMKSDRLTLLTGLTLLLPSLFWLLSGKGPTILYPFPALVLILAFFLRWAAVAVPMLMINAHMVKMSLLGDSRTECNEMQQLNESGGRAWPDQGSLADNGTMQEAQTNLREAMHGAPRQEPEAFLRTLHRTN